MDENSDFDSFDIEEDSPNVASSAQSTKALSSATTRQPNETAEDEDVEEEEDMEVDEQQTEETEPNDDMAPLRKDLSNIIVGVYNYANFSEYNVTDALRLLLEAPDDYQNHISKFLLEKFLKVLNEKNIEEDALNALLSFLAKITITAKSQSCKIPLITVHRIVCEAAKNNRAYVIARVCFLLNAVFSCASSTSYEVEDSASVDSLDQSAELTDDCIPADISDQWRRWLVCRLVDKTLSTRLDALKTLCHMQLDKEVQLPVKLKRPAVSLRKLIFDIVRKDGSSEFRRSACQLLPLTSKDDINLFLQLITFESVVIVRKYMIMRLISTLHVESFSDAQRMSLVEIVWHDSDGVVRELLERKIIPKWLSELARCDDDVYCSISSTVIAHPFALLNLFDVLEHEVLLSKLLKCALRYYISTAFSGRVQKYFDEIYHAGSNMKNAYNLLIRQSLCDLLSEEELIPGCAEQIFGHRCLIELIAELLSAEKDLGEKDFLFIRLLPLMDKIAELTTIFAKRHLSEYVVDSEHSEVEFILRQCIYLMRLVEVETISTNNWRDALMSIISSEDIFSSPYLTSLACDDLIDRVLPIHPNKEDSITKLQMSVNQIVRHLPGCKLSQNTDPQQIVTQLSGFNDEQHSLIHRAGVVLKAVLGKWPESVESEGLLRDTFPYIVTRLGLNQINQARELSYLLMGLGCNLRFGVWLTHGLDLEKDSQLQEACVISIYRMIAKHGMDKVVAASFPEFENPLDVNQQQKFGRECMILLENAVLSCEMGLFMNIARLSVKILLAHHLSWGTLIGAIFFKQCSSNAPTIDKALEILFPAEMYRSPFAPSELLLLCGYSNALHRLSEEKDACKSFRFSYLMEFMKDRFKNFNSAARLFRTTILILEEIVWQNPVAMSHIIVKCLGSLNVQSLHESCLSDIFHRLNKFKNLEDFAHYASSQAVVAIDKILARLKGKTIQKRSLVIIEDSDEEEQILSFGASPRKRRALKSIINPLENISRGKNRKKSTPRKKVHFIDSFAANEEDDIVIEGSSDQSVSDMISGHDEDFHTIDEDDVMEIKEEPNENSEPIYLHIADTSNSSISTIVLDSGSDDSF